MARAKKQSLGKRALYATGRGIAGAAKNSYQASRVGKDYSDLGGSLLNSTVGLAARALRAVFNTANYAARTVVAIPEGLTKGFHNKFVGHLEEDLEGKVAYAEGHDSTTITLSPDEIEEMHRVGADKSINHLAQKIYRAELEQHPVRLSVDEAKKALRYMATQHKTDILDKYRGAAAVISFIVALLSFDQIRLTGFAVSEATGGHDYYSLFGFLFLALAALLFLSSKERK